MFGNIRRAVLIFAASVSGYSAGANVTTHEWRYVGVFVAIGLVALIGFWATFAYIDDMED